MCFLLLSPPPSSHLDTTTEAIVRGHKVGGMLTAVDYNNLTQCESLDDIKLNLVRRSLG